MPAIPPPLETLRGTALLALLGLAGATGAAELPTLDCVITPSAKVELSSAVPGLIAAVHVDRSDTVERGQVVAELTAGVERAAVSLARTKAAMDAEVHLRAVSLEFDRRNQRRMRDLASRAMASQQDKDRADRDTQLSRWELLQAENLMDLRGLELARAEEILKEKLVVSPIDGVVVQRYKSPGEYVEDRPILRVVRLDPLHVETIVPMEYFGQLHPGMAAEVVPETLPAAARRARVAVVDRMGDAASGTFGLRLEMANPGSELPAGTKCSVRFLPGEPAPELEAPQGIPALTPAPPASAKTAPVPETPLSALPEPSRVVLDRTPGQCTGVLAALDATTP